MSRRVYIHQASGLGSHRKAMFIGLTVVVIAFVLFVQTQLTFSEHAIAKARNEFGELGQGVRSGAEELSPGADSLNEVRDTVLETKDAFARERQVESALIAAAAAAAASLEASSTPEAGTTETTPTSDTAPQPEPTSTTP
ncbi:MAG: hypothetical protein NUV56_04110 [Candidatus Uhrbacteria bacterium]|nr:hypothetical protein [Candidatus Uhrbacteria bacterium]